MTAEAPEKFVDGERAAEFLSLPRRRVLELARRKVLPGWPLGCGTRKIWRFRLSELARAITELSAGPENSFRPPGVRSKPLGGAPRSTGTGE
jgi:hypothetical protein